MRNFHNGGHIRRGRRDLAVMNTHLELESLPAGGWGYDHFPLSARYVRALGMEYLGMSSEGFAIDLGVRWVSANPFKLDYFRPDFELNNLGDAAYVFYAQGQKIELNGGAQLGKREDSFFNRDIFTFCSHQHTPNSLKDGGLGMVESKNGIYLAWNVFDDYATLPA